MPTHYEEFIKNLFAAWNAHDVCAVVSFYAPNYEELDVARRDLMRGTENVRRTCIYYLRAFPDLKIVLDDCLVVGNRAALYWTWTGTQRGTFMNIPPMGHTVKVRGTSLILVEGGKLRRALRIWDLAGLLRDLKLLPELSA
jgi:steroid delta-isomerase-like uncharacterized protein